MTPLRLFSAVLLLLAAEQQLSAQSCFGARNESALLLSAGRVQHASVNQVQGWGGGARAERNLSNALALGASYRYEALTGAALHVAGLGTALRLAAPARPCLTLDIMGSIGTALGSASHYRNLTAPLGLLFTHPGVVSLYAGPQLIFSSTSANLLSYTLRNYAIGYGMLAGARMYAGVFLADFTIDATTLGSALGPQPLGRFRADLAFGVRL